MVIGTDSFILYFKRAPSFLNPEDNLMPKYSNVIEENVPINIYFISDFNSYFPFSIFYFLFFQPCTEK